ncbi:ead/Ea22-like family protein [Klebsiella pneumoniae]
MTDITELAQSLKAAAEKATPGRWEYYPGNTSIEYNVDSMGEDQGSVVYVDSGDFTQAQTDRNGEFIALANPENILALVEALEKSEKTSEARREAIDITHKRAARERDRANAAEEALEKAQQQMTESENRVRKQNRHICELFDDNTALRQRIAELESRTVKLPEPFELAGLSGGSSYYYADEVDVALTAQGIKVEAE